MSAMQCPEAGRLSLRSLCLLLIVALAGVTARVACAASPISFLPPVNYDKPGAGDVTAIDLDGDGKLDLAVIGGGAISVLYGNGDGTFQARVDIPLGPGINDGQNQIVAADLNGDGLPDLVATIFGLQKIVVLMNRGNRNFGPPVSYTVGTAPTALTAGDFNGDGKLDLAVSNHLSNNLCVLLNKGDGTFLPPVFYPGGSYAARVVSGDFNGDGNLDLAMSNYVSGNVLVYLGDGKGGFTVAGDYRTGGDYPGELITDDFNGDGKPDLVAPNAYSASVSVLLGDGSGKFGVPILYAANDGAYITGSADLDGDGNPDLVVGNNLTNYFSVLQNTGEGTFLPPVRFTSGGNNARTVAIGDFNGDGRPDVAIGNLDSGTISVFINSTPWPTPALRSLTLDLPSLVGGCQSASGTVTITAVAPAGGAVVALASSNPAIAVPAEVLIPAGAVQARFSVPTQAASAPRWASISAAYNGTAKRASLLVRALAAPQVTISPTQVIGGQPAVGQVTIACPAGPGGLTILLASNSPSVDVPASVTVPPGAATIAFPILTYKVATATTATISAGPPGATTTAALQLFPSPFPPQPPVPTPTPFTLSLFPNPVPGGLLALGQVTLAQPAGLGGAIISLTSSLPVAVVPATIAVLPGNNTATFPIITIAVSRPTSVTIAAGGASGSVTTTLELLPLGSVPPVNLLINGVAYTTSDRQETLAATFTQPDGGVTASAYQGYVLLHVTGVGQSYGPVYNDAFYLYTGPFTSPQNGHDGGYYQLAFGTSPLQPFSLASNARNFLVGPLPAYNPAHDYTFILDTRLASPGRLHFGVTDGGYNDNTGAYTITVTQLVAVP